MNAEEMRKEFEAWCPDSVQRESDGGYKQPFTRAFWKAWQAALATQPQAPQGAVTGWQPIETAPKDRCILLWNSRLGAIRGDWRTDKYSKKPRPYWSHDLERVFGVLHARAHQPTHWMPLPAAPETPEGKK